MEASRQPVLSRRSQVPQLKALWLSAFPGDTPEDVSGFFERVYRPEECLVMEEDGLPVSMAFLLPAHLPVQEENLSLQYVYAAATRPDRRGKGLFSALLRAALERGRKQGAAASFLRPADAGLQEYYGRFGYRPFFRVRVVDCGRTTLLTAEPAGVTPCRVTDYAALRGAFLQDIRRAVRWPDRLAVYEAESVEKSGGFLLAGRDGFALCEPRSDGDGTRLLTRELLCRPGREKAMMAAVAAHYPADAYRFRLPAGEAEPDTEGFGLLCPLSRRAEGLFAGHGYMGPAFD